MDRVKTLRKYAIWVILFYLFSSLFIYIGLNSRYKNIKSFGEIPNGVIINLAHTTAVNGRIFGEVKSTEDNNLNGKYLKVDIFSKSNELMGTKYLKLEDINLNEPRKFAVYFQAENIQHFKIDVKEYNEDLEQDMIKARELYKKTFKDEDIPLWLIILLIAYGLA